MGNENIANIVCSEMIKIKTDKDKTFMEVLDNILKKYENIDRNEVLILIPNILTIKGYEIDNKNYFNLIKY